MRTNPANTPAPPEAPGLSSFLQALLPKRWEYPQHLHSREPEHQFVLLTGATNGIGAEILKSLISQGHTVVTHYRDEAGRERLLRMRDEALARCLTSPNYPSLFCERVDLTDVGLSTRGNSKLSEFCEWAGRRVPKLDSIVFNAGESGIGWSGWAQQRYRANLWIASLAASLEMLVDNLHDFDEPKHLRGRVLYVSSALADQAVPGLEAYHRIKRHGERTLDFFFRPDGYFRDEAIRDILAFSVRPGSVDTRLHREDCLQHGGPVVQARTQQLITEGRLRDPRIVGSLIAQLALTGCTWNHLTGEFSTPVERCGRVLIDDGMYSSYKP